MGVETIAGSGLMGLVGFMKTWNLEANSDSTTEAEEGGTCKFEASLSAQ